jgi:hypothetical protein
LSLVSLAEAASGREDLPFTLPENFDGPIVELWPGVARGSTYGQTLAPHSAHYDSHYQDLFNGEVVKSIAAKSTVRIDHDGRVNWSSEPSLSGVNRFGLGVYTEEDWEELKTALFKLDCKNEEYVFEEAGDATSGIKTSEQDVEPKIRHNYVYLDGAAPEVIKRDWMSD